MSFFKRFAIFAMPLGAVAIAAYARHLKHECDVPVPTVPVSRGYGSMFPAGIHTPYPVKWDHIKIGEMLKNQPQYRYSHFEAFYRNVQTEDARVALFHFMIALTKQQNDRPVLGPADLRRAVTKVFGDIEQKTEEICAKYVEFMRKN
jgi:hypothetical protein